MVAIAVVACSGDGDGVTSTPTAGATPTIDEVVAPAGSPPAIVENVIQACREKDGAGLKSFIAGAVDDTQVEDMLAGGSDVRLGGYSWEAPEENTALVTVGLLVRRNGSTERVQRTWDLVRGDDGVWRLTELPDCY